MTKKLFTLILSCMLLIALFAGCSPGGGESSAPSKTESSKTSADASKEDSASTEEPYEVNFLYVVAKEGSNQGKVEQAVSDLAMKELNMKVHLIPMTFGTYFQQLPLMLAANEDLDLFPAMSNEFATYIESQYIVNCADYLDEAKDIISVLGEEEAFTPYIGDFLVGFAQMRERGYPVGLIVRQDLFQELGYKTEDFSVSTDDYNSYQQLTALFAKVKEAHPNITAVDGSDAIMGLMDNGWVDNLGSLFGVLEDYGQTTTVTNWFESEQYRTFCEIAREWYQAGYISQDIAVSQDDAIVKMKAGNCFSFFSYIKPNSAVEKESQCGYPLEIIPIGKGFKGTNGTNSCVYSIANASKDPRKAMKFLNWAYTSQEFMDLLNWGIEGEDWVKNEEGLATYPEGVDASSVGYHNDMGFIYPNQFVNTPWVGNPVDIWEQYKEYNGSMMKSKGYGFTFDSSVVSTEMAQLNTVYEQYKKDLAFGVIDIESGLKDFNDALYAAGLQKVIDEKQKQLNEWLAAKEE